MPSAITHELIAEEAKEKFPGRGREAADGAKSEFFLGAQGPDVFFFYRIGNRSEYNLGKFMHRNRVFDVFSVFLDALRGEHGAPRFDGAAKTRVLSYVLGYICHYASDSVFHPFVYNYLDAHNCPKRIHQQMENDWDVYFLRERKGESVERYRFPFSPSELKKDGSIARLYAYLAERLEREEVSKTRFDAGVKNFARYLKFFHGKCYGAQRGWARTERFFHAKPLLGALYPREDPEPAFLSGEGFSDLSEGRGGNADELFALAVSESARLAERFLSALEQGGGLPRGDFNKGLLTGKELD